MPFDQFSAIGIQFPILNTFLFHLKIIFNL